MSDILKADTTTTTIRTGLEARKQQGTEDRQSLEAQKAEEAERESIRTDLEARKKYEIKRAEEKAKAEADELKFKAENIQLDNGEWINKAEYEKLSEEDRKVLKEKGIAEFNKYLSEKQGIEQKKFEEANIQLKSGEWVSKEEYDKLDADSQKKLMEDGIDKFNEAVKKLSEREAKEIEFINKIEQYRRENEARGYPIPPMAIVPIYNNKGELVSRYSLYVGYGATNDYIKIENDDGTLNYLQKGLKDDYIKLATMLPEGWKISPDRMNDQYYVNKYGVSQVINITRPDGKSILIGIPQALKEFQETGNIYIKPVVPIPSMRGIEDIADKGSYTILDPAYQGATQIAKFKIDGKEYSVNAYMASWYANLLDKIKTSTKYSDVSAPSNIGGRFNEQFVVNLTDKDGNTKPYMINDAWAMLATEGEADADIYVPKPPESQYGSPYALPTSLGGGYGSVTGVSVMPTTPYQEVNVPFRPQVGLPELKDTLGIINELNQGRIKESELTEYQSKLLNNQAVKLDSGDYTLKEDYYANINLPVPKNEITFATSGDTELDSVLKQVNTGINVETLAEKDKVKLSSGAIQIKGGEWIANTELDKLSEKEKEILINQGTAAFKSYVEKNYININGLLFSPEDWESTDQEIKNLALQGKEYYEQWANKQKEILERDYIKVGKKEYMLKTDYENLGKSENGETLQRIVKQGGLTSLNDYLSLTNIKLDNGQWVNKELFNSMPELMQKEAKKYGMKAVSLNPYDFEDFKNPNIQQEISVNAIKKYSLTDIFKPKEKSAELKQAEARVGNEILNRMDRFGLLKNPDGTTISKDYMKFDGFKPVYQLSVSPETYDKLPEQYKPYYTSSDYYSPFSFKQDAFGNTIVYENKKPVIGEDGNVLLQPDIQLDFSKMPSKMIQAWTPPKETINNPLELQKWFSNNIESMSTNISPYTKMFQGVDKAELAKNVIIPFYTIATQAGRMSPTEVLGQAAFDTVFTGLYVYGGVRMTSGLVRAGETLPKAIAKTVIADITAPYQMLKHPIQTIKAPYYLFNELVGGLKTPRIAEPAYKASMKGTWGSDIKVPVNIGHGSEASALESVGELVKSVATGTQKAETTSGVASIIMRDTGMHKYINPSVVHATPSGEDLLEQSIKNNGKIPIDDTMFSAPTGTWFDKASSKGTRGQLSSHFVIDLNPTGSRLGQLPSKISKLEEPAKIQQSIDRLGKAGKLGEEITPVSRQYKDIIEAEANAWKGSDLGLVPSADGKLTKLSWKIPDAKTMVKYESLVKEIQNLSRKIDDTKDPIELVKLTKHREDIFKEADKLYELAVKRGTTKTVELDVDFVKSYDMLTGEDRYIFHTAFYDDIANGLVKSWTKQQLAGIRREGIRGIFSDITQAHIEYPKLLPEEQLVKLALKVEDKTGQARLGSHLDAYLPVEPTKIPTAKMKTADSLPGTTMPVETQKKVIQYLKDNKVMVQGSWSEFLQNVDVDPADVDTLTGGKLNKLSPKQAAEGLAEILKKEGINPTVTEMKAVEGYNVSTPDGLKIQFADAKILGGKKGIYNPSKSQVPFGWVISTDTYTPDGLRITSLSDQLKMRLDNLVQPGIRTGKGRIGPEVSGKEWRVKDIEKYKEGMKTLIAEAKAQNPLLDTKLIEERLAFALGEIDNIPILPGSKAELASSVTKDNIDNIVSQIKAGQGNLPRAIGTGIAGGILAYALQPRETEEGQEANVLQLMAAAMLITSTKGKTGKVGKLIRNESKITKAETEALEELANLDRNVNKIKLDSVRRIEQYFNSARFSKAVHARSVIAALSSIPRTERGLAELTRTWENRYPVASEQIRTEIRTGETTAPTNDYRYAELERKDEQLARIQQETQTQRMPEAEVSRQEQVQETRVQQEIRPEEIARQEARRVEQERREERITRPEREERPTRPVQEQIVRGRATERGRVTKYPRIPDYPRIPEYPRIRTTEPIKTFKIKLGEEKYNKLTDKQKESAVCFRKGTKVLVIKEAHSCNGYGNYIKKMAVPKRIEEISIGELVYSYNEINGSKEYKPVTKTFINKSSELLEITFAEGNKLYATPEHPIAVINNEGKLDWVIASKLQIGDKCIKHYMAGIYSTINKGKSNIDLYGVEKAKDISIKQGIARIGNKNFLGHKHKEESKVKMARYGNKYWVGKKHKTESIEKIRNSKIGLVQSDEARQKRSVSMKQYLSNIDNLRKHMIAKHIRPTSIEIQLEMILNNICPNEFKYNGDGRLGIAFDRMSPDFVNVNGKKKVIEIYTAYWKDVTYGSIDKYQEIRKERLNNIGFDVLFIEDKELTNEEELKNKIIQYLYNPNIKITHVESVKNLHIEVSEDVFNLEVADNNNYFAEGILVHNCWKQGVMYKMWYEPYGQKDIINSPYPIPGVQYESGVGAAYRSMVARYGELPRTISRDMGIQDITVKPTKDPNRPQMFFTEDRHQRTKRGRKIISKSRIIKKNGVRKKGLTFDTLMSI